MKRFTLVILITSLVILLVFPVFNTSCTRGIDKSQIIQGVSTCLIDLRCDNYDALSQQIKVYEREYADIVADIETLDEEQAAAMWAWELACSAAERNFNSQSFDSLFDWELHGDDEYIPPPKPSESNWEIPRQRLMEEKAGVLGAIDYLKDKQDASKAALSILQQHSSNWEVAEVMTGVYQAEGYGLGYYDGQTSVGVWYYYENGPSIEPRDTGSMKLHKILTMSTS